MCHLECDTQFELNCRSFVCVFTNFYFSERDLNTRSTDNLIIDMELELKI